VVSQYACIPVRVMSGVCFDGVTSPFKVCPACTVNAMPLAVDKGFLVKG
jgi:hypothetical protein